METKAKTYASNRDGVQQDWVNTGCRLGWQCGGQRSLGMEWTTAAAGW